MKTYNTLLVAVSFICFTSNAFAEPDRVNQQVNILQQQAKQGNADAMNDLGNMYSDGNGVPQDRTKSLVLLKKAYRLGNPEAAFNIAVIYYTGNDPYESISWFQKAAKQGNGEASNNLGIIYGYGQGVSQDTDKAMKYFKQACKHNSIKGCVNYEKIQ